MPTCPYHEHEHRFVSCVMPSSVSSTDADPFEGLPELEPVSDSENEEPRTPSDFGSAVDHRRASFERTVHAHVTRVLLERICHDFPVPPILFEMGNYPIEPTKLHEVIARLSQISLLTVRLVRSYFAHR